MIPASVLGAWESLKEVLDYSEQWDVWLNWYESLLTGHAELSFHRALAAMSLEIWDEEPKVTNAALASLLSKEGASDREVISRREIPPTRPLPGRGRSTEARSQAAQGGLPDVWYEGRVDEIAARISRDPALFEQAASGAARAIDMQLRILAERIPNEPEAHAGYEEVKRALIVLKRQFEELADGAKEVEQLIESPVRSTRTKQLAEVARQAGDGFLDWVVDNGPRAGRIVAHLGLAAVVSASVNYVAGVNPTLTFLLATGALSGEDIWDVVKMFVKKEMK